MYTIYIHNYTLSNCYETFVNENLTVGANELDRLSSRLQTAKFNSTRSITHRTVHRLLTATFTITRSITHRIVHGSGAHQKIYDDYYKSRNCAI
jgi:hypothetical protein